MRFLLLIILWVLTPQGLQIGEVFYNNQRIKIMKLNLNNPAFLQSASNVSGEIVPAGNPYYIKGREDNTTVTFKFQEYTQVSSDGVLYTDAPESMIINSGEKIYLKYIPITTPIEMSEILSAFDIDKPFDAGGFMEPVKFDFSYDGTSYKYAVFAMDSLPIVDAKHLIIDISSDSEFITMCSFLDCTNLVNAPKLPATTLAENCYQEMFSGCTSLVNAPELPATTLAESCYNKMFLGCTSLVNAPELPATTLATNCYFGMFLGCTNLVNAPELPATTLASACYNKMFSGCTSLVNAPELPATTLASACYDSMFKDCSSLVNTPELPATTLESGCYHGMFLGCTNLVNAPELPATTLTNACYMNMFDSCTSLVNAPELPATTLDINCYFNMFSGCNSLKRVVCLATDISASTHTHNWLYNVPDSGVFIKAPGVEWPTGADGIPDGWTVEEYAG